jgi:hypothetical protein
MSNRIWFRQVHFRVIDCQIVSRYDLPPCLEGESELGWSWFDNPPYEDITVSYHTAMNLELPDGIVYTVDALHELLQWDHWKAVVGSVAEVRRAAAPLALVNPGDVWADENFPALQLDAQKWMDRRKWAATGIKSPQYAAPRPGDMLDEGWLFDA